MELQPKEIKINKYFIPDNTKTLGNISECVILQQLLYNAQHKIQFTKYYKHNLKKYLKLANTELQKAEISEYDELFDEAEEAVVVLYNSAENMVKLITDLGIAEYQNIVHLLIAYKTDPASIKGIVKKVNKQLEK